MVLGNDKASYPNAVLKVKKQIMDSWNVLWNSQKGCHCSLKKVDQDWFIEFNTI